MCALGHQSRCLSQDDDNLQIFVAENLPDESVRVKLLNTDLCLDSSAGNQLVPYPCYADSQENPNQAWKIQRSRLVWEDAIQSVCVDAPVPPGNLRLRKLPPQPIWTLAPCVDKVGQHLQKEDMKPDGTFLLKDADAGRCLAARKVLSLETPLVLAPCNDRQRFRELKDRNQVQHVSTGYCVDAGNDAPILYPCHEPRALRKQRFEVKDTPGWLQLMRGWEDNGRKRFFERCFDRQPQPPTRVVLRKCEEVEAKGVKWRRINFQEPWPLYSGRL